MARFRTRALSRSTSDSSPEQFDPDQDDTCAMSESERSRSYLIEFVGAAGVGKSYLASKLQAALSDCGLPVFDFQRLEIDGTAKNLWIALRAAMIGLWLRPRTPSCYVNSLDRLARHWIRIVLSRRSPGVYVCDEGIFQKIRAFRRNSRLTAMTSVAERVFSQVPLPDVVVIVESDAAQIFARRTRRGRPRDHFDLSSVRNDVLLMEESLMTIRHVQESNPSMLIVRMDIVDQDTNETVARLAKHLRAAMSNTVAMETEVDLRGGRSA